MSAMVARTVSIGRSSCRIPAAGDQAARVTHTLLFLVAQLFVLVPGVCDACVKDCCANSTPQIADVASPIFAADTAAGGGKAGHCCGVTATDDVAADPCVAGDPAHCRCQLEPRDVPPAAASADRSHRRGEQRRWDDAADAGAVAWLPPSTGQCDGRQPLAGGMPVGVNAAPTRPVRVLYGVWRN